MSECTGKKDSCAGDNYLGEGIFSCGYFDSSKGGCTLEEYE